MVKILGLLLLLVVILKTTKSYTTIETSLVDEYINGYYNNIYIDEELLVHLKNNENDEYIKNLLVNSHRKDVINELGGSEKILELIKLLKDSKNEEEEEEEKVGSIYGYSYELRDNLDKIILTSRLDGNYHNYLNSKGEINRNSKEIQVTSIKIKFKIDLRNIFDIKNQRKYEFEAIVSKLLKDPSDGLIQERVNVKDKIVEFSNGFYINNGVENLLKIESPMEMITFKELVLIDKINMLIDSTNIKKSNNDLLKGYPVCEIKCVIKELQNKIQWSESISRLSSENISYIKSYNWCNKLIFHNCVDLGIKSFELSIISDKMKKEIEQIRTSIDHKIKSQIENYFLSNLEMLSIPFDFNIIIESIILNVLLEKNSFVIKKNMNNDLIIKYEKISEHSKSIVCLEQILNNVDLKLELGNKKNNYSSYENRQHRVLSSNEYIDSNHEISRLSPVKKSKLILNIEHVTIFIQNILLILKTKSKANYYLPWYVNRSGIINIKRKQDEFVGLLFREYELLLRLFMKNKYIGKDMFYRMGLFNIYSLISHFKSYNTNNTNNSVDNIYNRKKSHDINENGYIIVNTRLNYEDQIFITNIYSQNLMFHKFNINNKGNIRLEKYKKIEYFKPINEYYTQNSENDFSINFNDVEEYFDGIDYLLDINYYERNLINKTIEVSRPIKIVDYIKGNLDFYSENTLFQNNIGNYGFNIAFLNYMYYYTLNLDDNVIDSTPWWMAWQSQFYPPVYFGLDSKIVDELGLNEKYTEEDGYDYNEGNEKSYFSNLSKKIFNSTLIEIPINSDFPISFFDLGSYLPKDIISKGMLESIIMEEVEFINPTFKGIDSLLDGKNRKFDLIQLTKERQQILINSWKRSDLINDPNNMLFYNHNKLSPKTEFTFNPCMLNTFFDNDSSEWFSACVKKWEIYTTLFDHFSLKSNRHFKISTFFDVIKEVKMILYIQKEIYK
ncbi:hypothetical protein FG379_000787 [Cryptosporidium bovis]|uniref:uncharacterized protein n=1 Tax=Cryptosporidium bovis TaxID=310047 RepID=UPI00351A45F6|nr:hypothetical protein FG379_000787 [Cryptosporidium bovis]